MLHLKEKSVQPLLKSKGGVHLTSYLQNRGSVVDFKRQIYESLSLARGHLIGVMEEDELSRFLAPLSQLLIKPDILSSFKSNVGLFRTKDSFRMVSISVDVDHLCVVATSFHVKPLLRWIRADREFLLLSLEAGSASLHMASQSSFKHVGTIFLPQYLESSDTTEDQMDLNRRRVQTLKVEETVEWLNEWLYQLTTQQKLPLFLSGEKNLLKRLLLRVRYPNLRRKSVDRFFSQQDINEVIAMIREKLRKEEVANLEESIVEFYWAEDMNLGQKNIFQIARSAIQGKIRKLIVADEVQIFGKLDKLTGSLNIHPVHLDHEDDDLLDDLAQAVISRGGEVIVAPIAQIPKGRPILAILKGHPEVGVQASQFRLSGQQRTIA